MIVQLRGGDPRRWLVVEVVDGGTATAPQRVRLRVEPGFEGSGSEQWAHVPQLVPIQFGPTA